MRKLQYRRYMSLLNTIAMDRRLRDARQIWHNISIIMDTTMQLYRLEDCIHEVYALAGGGFKNHDRKAVDEYAVDC